MIVIPEKMYSQIETLQKRYYRDTNILMICEAADSIDTYKVFMIMPVTHWAKNLTSITNTGKEKTLKVFALGEKDYYSVDTSHPLSDQSLLTLIENDMRWFINDHYTSESLARLAEIEIAIKDFKYKRIAFFQKPLGEIINTVRESLYKEEVMANSYKMVTEADEPMYQDKSGLIAPTPYISLMLASSNISEDTIMDDCKTSTKNGIVLCLDSTDPADNKMLCEVFKELKKSAPTQFVSNGRYSILVDPSDLWKILRALSSDYHNRSNSWLIGRIHEITSYLVSGDYNIILTYNQYKEGDL